VSGEKVSNKISAPFFKSLRKYGVVSISKASVSVIPSSLNIDLFNIEKNSEKFNYCHSWVSVV
jgi:hypothetical protein